MSLEKRYFNLSTLQWVQSFDSPNQVNSPTWGQGDARDFQVTFVESISATKVAVVESVVSAQVGLSNPATPSTLLTSATAGPAVNNAFPFVLNITGAGVTTFMNGETQAKNTLLEFRISTTLGTNRYRSQVFLSPQQITDATGDPAPPDRTLGFDEARGLYVPKEWPVGMRMIVTDEVTNQLYSVGFANGQFQANLL
jgi:hypothetical protein